MKKLRILICLIAVLAVSLSLAGCKRENVTPTTSPAQNDAQTTQQETDLPSDASPKRFSTSLPTDNAVPDYNSIDKSGFYETENDKGQTFLSSVDKDHTVTYLTDENDELYAYKYTETADGVDYYYGVDGALYAVGTDDYTGVVLYFVTPDLTLLGIQATTHNDFVGDVEMRIDTVYNEKGIRVAAMATETKTQAKSYYDDKLMLIPYETYFDLVKDYVDLRG